MQGKIQAVSRFLTLRKQVRNFWNSGSINLRFHSLARSRVCMHGAGSCISLCLQDHIMSICSIVSQHTCRALSRAASDLKVWNSRRLLRCHSFCSSSARFEVTCRSGRAAPSGFCQRRIPLREFRNSKRPVMTSAVQEEAVIDVEAETIDERVPCTVCF